MNRHQAARNTLKTAIEVALSESAGHSGIQLSDQNNARRIVDGIDRLIALHVAGTLEEHYD